MRADCRGNFSKIVSEMKYFGDKKLSRTIRKCGKRENVRVVADIFSKFFVRNEIFWGQKVVTDNSKSGKVSELSRTFHFENFVRKMC